MPRIPLQNDPKVADWYGIAVHGVRGHRSYCLGREVCGNLVIKEVKIDPASALAAYLASEESDIKLPCNLEIAHRKSQMKSDTCHACLFSLCFSWGNDRS